MTPDLATLIKAHIDLIGPDASAEEFGVSVNTIRLWREGVEDPFCQAAQIVLDAHMEVHPPQIWDIGKKVLILLPCYRSLNIKTHCTLIRNYTLYGRDKVAEIPKERTIIWEARNQLAEAALATPSEQFVFVDDDMLLPYGYGPGFRGFGCDIAEPMASQVALTRLLSHPADKLIVSALAFTRHSDHLRAGCSDGHDSKAANDFLVTCRTQYRNSLKKQRWVGMFFTRIHRLVFERMIAEASQHFPEIIPSRPNRHHGWFTPFAQDQGEDSAFCLRAQKIGIDNWVDCGLPIGHVGEKVY